MLLLTAKVSLVIKHNCGNGASESRLNSRFSLDWPPSFYFHMPV